MPKITVRENNYKNWNEKILKKKKRHPDPGPGPAFWLRYEILKKVSRLSSFESYAFLRIRKFKQ